MEYACVKLGGLVLPVMLEHVQMTAEVMELVMRTKFATATQDMLVSIAPWSTARTIATTMDIATTELVTAIQDTRAVCAT